MQCILGVTELLKHHIEWKILKLVKCVEEAETSIPSLLFRESLFSDFGGRSNAYAKKIVGYKTGEMVSMMIPIGDEFGQRQAMSGKGLMSAGDLIRQMK